MRGRGSLRRDRQTNRPKSSCSGEAGADFGRESAVAVDDPAAVQVVRRDLDLDPVAGLDPDPVPAHLPCRVAHRLVPIVERDPVHPVAERLGDLALELDLLLLGRHAHLPGGAPVRAAVAAADGSFASSRYATWMTFAASGPFCPSRASNSTFAPSARVLK